MRTNNIKPLKILYIFVTICIVTSFSVACSEVEQKVPEPTIYESLTIKASASPTPEVEASETPMPLAEQQLKVIELQKANPDVVAWIEIPNTRVNYPVMQGEDNNFYLERNENKEIAKDGGIFIDIANSPNLEDRNTVIYGHRMNSGTMFADLHLFEDEEFFKANKVLNIYFPNEIKKYEIFATYKTGDEYIPTQWNFDDDKVWEGYITQIASQDKKADPEFLKSITAEEKIVTLSTCVRNEDTKRYLLQAVLI